MRDAQGHELSGATTEGIRYFNSAVRAFTLIYGDATGLYDAALKVCPELVMAYLGKAWPLVLANDPAMAVLARALLNAVCELPMNDRERAHLTALTHAAIGHRASAVAILDRHLMSHPFDLIAHMAALQMERTPRAFPLGSRPIGPCPTPVVQGSGELRDHAVVLQLRIGRSR